VTFSEAMAARVVELEAALRAARIKTRRLERSRDLWRTRYEHAMTANARHRNALNLVNYRERKAA
jgi:hypothetical protein